MKKIAILLMCSLFILGCGPSEAEKQKIKKEKEEHELTEHIKSQVKDPNSVAFRNVMGNCGEINAKNGFGAYVGFKRFLVKPDGQVVIENEDENTAFIPLWKEFCKNNNLVSSPETMITSLPDQARALDLNPEQWDRLTPKQQIFAIRVGNDTLKKKYIDREVKKGKSYEQAKFYADHIVDAAGAGALGIYSDQ